MIPDIRSPLAIACAIAALAGGLASTSDASPLEPAADSGLIAPGLVYRTAGSSLDESDGTGSGRIEGIHGSVLRAVLYWAGSHEALGFRHDTIEFNGALVDGDLVGTETYPGRTAYAYRADVSSVIEGKIADDGTIDLAFKDLLFDDPFGRIEGATLVLAFGFPGIDEAGELVLFEGSDFGWAPYAPAPPGLIDEILMPSQTAMPGERLQLTLVVGQGTPEGRDQVLMSGNPTAVDVIDGSSGPGWDVDMFDVEIPLRAGGINVQVDSPIEEGLDADRLHWVAAVLGRSCDGAIGDFVWLDQNQDGIQDPGEIPLVDVPVQLFRLDGGEEILVAETTTDGDGLYAFTGLCSGVYRVVVPTTLPDLALTIPNAGDDDVDSDFDPSTGSVLVTLDDDATIDLTIDAGYRQTTSLQVGACCYPDGSCEDELSEEVCLTTGGVYQGDFTECVSSECEIAPGACCLPDGSCIEAADADECSVAGGDFQDAGTLCDDVECPVLPGACCLADGTCIQAADMAACMKSGGVFQGHGTDCADAVCPVEPGACCLADGTCIEADDAEACMADGGMFQGAGKACDDTDCPILPGACCLVDGTCIEVADAAACDVEGGEFAGPGTLCSDVDCDALPGACCLPDGTCTTAVDEADCMIQGGMFQGFGTDCADVVCDVLPGACCLADGTCIEVADEAACMIEGGDFQGHGVACGNVTCPVLPGACCLVDGTCVEADDVADCAAQGGTFQGAGVPCETGLCPPPTGACCFVDGSCEPLTEEDCGLAGGTFQGPLVPCEPDLCPVASGACCLDDGTCVEVTPDACDAQGGTFQGFLVPCGDVDCPQPVDSVQRTDASSKGSLLVLPRIETRWDPSGEIVRDTFVHLVNDFPQDVQVLMYVVNGQDPLDAVIGPGGEVLERAHPGWNFYDNEVTITKDQSLVWALSSGSYAGSSGPQLSPISVLDPGPPAGRPIDDGTHDREIRGFIVLWAIDESGAEIDWNHLAASVTVVDYRDVTAWEYNAYAFQSVGDLDAGDPTGSPGVLNLDGEEYAWVYQELTTTFQAVGADALSVPGSTVFVRNELTLLPVDVDVTGDSEAPVSTRADIAVWNENEVRFSGAGRCVNCWDSTLLGAYESPNHFLVSTLQTDFGRMRIDGIGNVTCENSIDAPLLGVIQRELRFIGHAGGPVEGGSGGPAADDVARAGRPLYGMGREAGTIEYSVVEPPPEAEGRSDGSRVREGRTRTGTPAPTGR